MSNIQNGGRSRKIDKKYPLIKYLRKSKSVNEAATQKEMETVQKYMELKNFSFTNLIKSQPLYSIGI